jgi:Fe(3+) dicitrate transport protein
MNDIVVNKASNNSRQIYSKIAGLNIWENDGAGIQLGIGGRGLNPNRVSNFNTRQNGYDMSADALGYPESYYSPPAEGVDRIEIVRGAASLQYGTQFGGLINFKLKSGPDDKPFEFTSGETVGSWKFFNTFNSIGGTVKKVNYYAFYQNKSGDGWRPNSEFNISNAYGAVKYTLNQKLSLTFQYTYMDYLAHQPGGLTDAEFDANPRQSIRDRNWFKVNWNLGAAMLDYSISPKLKLNSRFFGLMASRSALGILTFINRADPGGERDLWTDNYNNWGNETRLLFHYKIKNNDNALLVGTRYYSGHTTRKQGLGNDGSDGHKNDFVFNDPGDPEYSKYEFPNNNFSIFVENQFNITPKLSIIPGVRFENIQTIADGFYSIVSKDLAGNITFRQRSDERRSNNRSFVIAGIGAGYYQSEAMQFYANISQNYRAINFNNMRVVNPNVQVDLNLKDEKGYSADLGMRGNISGVLNYDVSLFLVEYDNRIGTVLKTDTATFNVYRLTTNVSQSINLGVESFAEVNIWKLMSPGDDKMNVSVFSNLSALNARYVNSKEPAFENKKVEFVPRVIFKTGLTIKRPRWSVSYQFSYTGKQFTDASNSTFTSNAINGLIPSYSIMDLTGEFQINKIFSVMGSINNLADKRYFTRRADSYPGPGIIPSDARGFYFTLQVKI